MSETTASFSESVPENYDRYMGPMVFEPYAEDLVERLQVRDEIRVLEVACGTGIVTRRLREVLPASAKLIATDLSEPMLAFARAKFSDESDIEWQQADVLALPFPDQSFDAVVCQFGLMFVPDPAAAIREMRRLLASGGQLLFNTWDRLEQNDFCNMAHRTQSTCFENDPPKFYEIPFSLHDTDLLQHWMQGAGLMNVAVRRVSLPSVSPSAAEAAKGLVQGTPLAVAIKERQGDLDAITEAVAAALRAEFGDNPLRGRMCALVAEGTR
jgi:ubiquinone/menaquinone biosynthesis C-methylase UbiE